MIAAVVRAMKESQRPSAVRALALLLALNTLCYLDRHILAAFEPEIRHAFFAPDDPGPDGQDRGVGHSLPGELHDSGPLLGWLADKHSRWAIIGSGAAVWSLATAGSGWAPTFGILLAARILVGAGEAAHGPAAPTLLSDLFPPARLGLVLAWAGGCEISRPRCSKSCAPIENFVGCASILGMLICFVCS
jgi:hypothetical protein